MSSLDGEESGTDEEFGIGFLSVAGDEDDAVRLCGLAADGFGEEVVFLSELCPDLQSSHPLLCDYMNAFFYSGELLAQHNYIS